MSTWTLPTGTYPHKGDGPHIGGTADEANSSFGLYGWDGEPEDEPVLLNGPFNLAGEGAWEDITSAPDPIFASDFKHVIGPMMN